jgi:hypothetical protein
MISPYIALLGYVTCPICGLKFKGEHFVDLGNKNTLQHNDGY